MDICHGSNPNELWQEGDDAEPGRPELPPHPAANNQNQISLPSASIPCLPLVSHPLDPECSRSLARADPSFVLPIIYFPIIIPCLVLSMESFCLLQKFSRSNPITARTGGIYACCEMSEVVYLLPRANLIT